VPELPEYGDSFDFKVYGDKISIVQIITSEEQIMGLRFFYDYLLNRYKDRLKISVVFRKKGEFKAENNIDVYVNEEVFNKWRIHSPYYPFFIVSAEGKVLFSSNIFPGKVLVRELVAKYLEGNHLKGLEIQGIKGLPLRDVFQGLEGFKDGFIVVVGFRNMRCGGCMERVKKECRGKKCMVVLIDDVSKRFIGQVKEKIGLEIYVMRSAYLEGWRDKLPLMLKIEGGIITETREVL